MKRFLVCLNIFIIITLSGCSSPTQNANSPQSQANGVQASKSFDSVNPDLHNKEKVARFVIGNVIKDQSITVSSFIQEYEFIYGDLNSDQHDELVLVPKLSTHVYVIQSINGNYNLILDTPRGQHETKASIVDGFLRVDITGGGTGVQAVAMTLFHWDQKSMKEVIHELLLSSKMVNMNGQPTIDEIARIVGPLTNFEYSLTKKDYQAGQSSLLEKHQKYSWDAATIKFGITEIPIVQETPKTTPQESNKNSLNGNAVLTQFVNLIKENQYNEATKLCAPEMLSSVLKLGFKDIPDYLDKTYSNVLKDQIQLQVISSDANFIAVILKRDANSGVPLLAFNRNNQWWIAINEQ